MYNKKLHANAFKKFLCTLGSVATVVLMSGLTVQAKEVVVENGDIQAALNQADSTGETLTVVIPAGEYTVGNILYVSSNTVIEADGARIMTASNMAGHPVLHAMNVGSTSNVTVHGGTWVANDCTPLQIVGMSNSTYDGVTVEVGSGSCSYGFDIKDSTGISIKNSTLIGCGINAENSSGLTISGNSIQSAPALGIRVAATGNNTIQGNSVANSGRTGIQLEQDTASIVDGNTVSGSALTGVSGDHGEGLVIYSAEGTKVTNNTVTDTHSNVADNGNGIIVAYANNVTVDGNTVANSGNHGIQVSYQSQQITISNNAVSGSGRMGISISRGSQADLVKNTVSASQVDGIVYDGNQGGCSGTVDGCTVTNTLGNGDGDAGIYIESSNVVIKNSTVSDGASYGMLFSASTVTAENNQICQTNIAEEGFGVVINRGSTATLNGNRIGNFGRSGITANSDSVVNGTNNTVTINNQTGFKNNAINIGNASSQMLNNQLFVSSLTASSASGQNYYNNVEAGVVINGAKTGMTVTDGGRFAVDYPAQAGTGGIVLYVKNTDGNVICINAANGFTLDGTQGNTPGNTADIEQIEAFVVRLYQNTLGRTPDQSGLNTWVDLLVSGDMTGAEVAHGFFFSDEFLNKNLGNQEYIDILYQTMFGQAGDEQGRAFWMEELATGFSRLYIYHGFAESVQFQNLCAEYGIQSGSVTLTEARDLNRGVTQFVSRNYTKALGRTVDIEGLNTWCNEILNGMPPENVVWGFVFSDEFIAKNLSDDEFVNTMYATYFNRAADSEGYNVWMNLLAKGGTREDVVNGFSGAEEFHNLVASFNLPQ